MSLEKINLILNKLESNIKNHSVSKPEISKGDVPLHIDQSLKVINNVIIALQKSNPNTYKNDISLLGKVMFKLGFFPRGKAKAPKHVKPPEVILKEDLILQVNLAKTNIRTIVSLDKNAYFKHPLFGNINTKRVNRFLLIHTNHHLKIINDVLK